MAIEKSPDRTRRKPLTVLSLQMDDDLRQRDVGGLGDQPKDLAGVGLDPVRPLVAALRARRARARVVPAAHQLERSRGSNAEPVGSRPAAMPKSPLKAACVATRAGNIAALEAVLADIAALGMVACVVLWARKTTSSGATPDCASTLRNTSTTPAATPRP